MKYLIFFLKFFFTVQPLDWRNSTFIVKRSPVGFYRTYYKGLVGFRKLDNASMYDTQVSWLGENIISLKLENSLQLRRIAGKTYRTLDEGHFVKIPSMWVLLKHFYHE